MQIAKQSKHWITPLAREESSPVSSASGLAAGVHRTDADASNVLTEQDLEDPFKPQG
jgi:hypothetical protein